MILFSIEQNEDGTFVWQQFLPNDVSLGLATTSTGGPFKSLDELWADFLQPSKFSKRRQQRKYGPIRK